MIRHLASRTRRVLLAVLCLMLGGGAFAAVVTLTEGEDALLEERLLAVTPHLTVTAERTEAPTRSNLIITERPSVVELRVNVAPSKRREVKPFTEIAARVEGLGPAIAAVAPHVVVDGVFRSGTRFETVTVLGIDPVRETRIAHLASDMQHGTLEDLTRTRNGVALGAGLARALKVGLGESVNVVTPIGTVQALTVTGIFESGLGTVDDHRAYVNLALAQGLRRMPRNAVTGLGVQVRDVAGVADLRRQVETATGYRTETWRQTNAGLLDARARRRGALQLLAAAMFVAAAFGISNALFSIVLRKEEEIAALMARGVSRGGITRIVLIEGMLMGLAGGVLAALAGWGLAQLAILSGLLPQQLGGGALRLNDVPDALDPFIVLFTVAAAIVMSLVAAYLPARRASRFTSVPVPRGDGRVIVPEAPAEHSMIQPARPPA